MSSSTIGPAGVLPPDPVGARVVRGTAPFLLCGVVVSPVVDGRCEVDRRGPVGTDDWAWRDTEEEQVGHLALDLTTGSLDAGTRALWALLGLGEQPLTAPWWGWRYSESFGRERWLLYEHDPVYGDEEIVVVAAHDAAPADAEGDSCVEEHVGGYVVCTEATLEEDPRRALALVLAAVVEARR